jgi:hydrogenase-4 membrane subunit HyfE
VNPLLIALLGVMLVPLFVATWRFSLLGLSAQGFLMAMVASSLVAGPRAAGDWLTLFDLVAIRGVVAPMVLYLVMRRQDVPARLDIIPPSLLSWTVALAMVLVSFNVAEGMATDGGEQETLVAVAIAGLLIGFLVLATRGGPLSQIIGVLRIENSIALLELEGGQHHAPIAQQAGLLLAFIGTVVALRWYLALLPVRPEAPPESTAPEGPTL